MIQKLTANLSKSEEYGKKISQELYQIGSQILKTKIQISKLNEKIEQKLKQNEDLNVALKRQSEQSSNYAYKHQKMEIRLKQYNRKLILQQEIFDKKQKYNEQLKNKIQILEQQMQEEKKYDEVIEKQKNQLESMEVKVSKQSITIENFYYELMAKKKQVRAKQDQLSLIRKANGKLKRQIEAKTGDPNENKQNQSMLLNRNQIKQQQQKYNNLLAKKDKLNKDLRIKIDGILKICQSLEQVAHQNMQIKGQVSKTAQISQQIKQNKNTLLKMRDSIMMINKNI